MMKEAVILEADSLKIAGQLYLPDEVGQTSYPVVCVCHGIPSGNPPDPGDGGYPLLAERICHEGLAVFIFNFRGTGNSEGNLDILGWTRDLKTAIDYLYTLDELDRSNLSVLGFSGGAAVSVFVASQDKRISSVIACACPSRFNFPAVNEPQSLIERFHSIGAIRDKDFPQSVEKWTDGFKIVSPIKYIAGITPRPLLLVHGDADEVVNVRNAHDLYARAGEPKQLSIIEGGGHRLRRDEKAVTIITDWLKSRLLK